MNNGEQYKSDALLKHLLNHVTDHIYFKDLESRFILINDSFAEKLHLKPEDVAGKTDFDIFMEEHARPAFKAEQHIIKTGDPLLGLEERETWPDGHETWVSTSKMPMYDADRNVIGTFGISRDITAHKLNEIKLNQYAHKLTKVNKQMEEELHMAANLQHAFLPQFYPDFPLCSSSKKCVEFAHSYLANTQISGDLCAVNKLNNTEAAMLIFDVMGHGVRAALITAILHTMIGDLSRRDLSPGEFLSEMNRQLRPMLQAQDSFIFVTAACLILNAKTGELRGASAGHPAPLIIKTKEETPPEAELLHAALHLNGPALAIVENVEYKTFSLQLDSGDTVLLYTDGLLEEPNKLSEEFGIENVQTTIRDEGSSDPKQICHALVDAVQNFNEHEQLSDDVCLLAFRWNGCSECDSPLPSN